MSTSASDSRPQAQKTLESGNNKTMTSDSGPGLQKDIHSKGGSLNMSGPKTATPVKSESKTATPARSESKTATPVMSEPKTATPVRSESKTIAPKTSESRSSSTSKTAETAFVTPETSESMSGSRKASVSRSRTSESKSDSSRKSDSIQTTPDSNSMGSKSSGSISGFSKWSESKSSVSRTTDSKSSASRATDSKVDTPPTSEPKSHTLKASESTVSKVGPFSRAMNFLGAHVPIFSSRASRSSTSSQPGTKSPKQSGSASTALKANSKPTLLSSANPASATRSVSSASSAADRPGPLPDKFSWSRASYSAPSTQRPLQLREVPDSGSVSAVDIPTNSVRRSSLTIAHPATMAQSSTGPKEGINPTDWLANPAVLTTAQPVADIPEAVAASPQVVSLMAMSARRRPSLPAAVGGRKASGSKGLEGEVNLLRSGSRDGRADSITARHIKHRISFQTRDDPDEPFPSTSFVAWDVETPVALYMASTGPLAQPPITVMTALHRADLKHSNKPAYGVKERGKWKTITYQQLLETVNQAAKGFIKLGLDRYNIVAILGHNSTEWVVSHLAVIFAGGISAPMHVTSGDEDCYLYAKQIKCRIIIVGSAMELSRVLAYRSRLKDLLAIVQCSRDDFRKSEHVYSWDELLEMGKEVPSEVLRERAMQQAPNICCSIVQTIGTAAPPKTVMLSHDNVMWGSNSIGRNLSINDADGVAVSFMPLSYIVAQVMDIYIPIHFGVTVYFAPPTAIQESVFDIVREVRPTLFWTAGRLYDVLLGAIEASWSRNAVKKMLRRWAIKIGLKGYVARGQNRRMPMGWKAANSMVCQRIRKEFGLSRCVELMMAGGSVQQKVWDFYYGLNMALLMSYGMAESTGQQTMSLRDRHRMRSVGIEMDGCTTMIERPNEGKVGELLLKGRNIAMGYLDMRDKTLASFTEDGWFRSGDLGKRDEDGFLYIVGRIDQQIQLSTGETVLPVDIESSVHHHLPCVQYCMVVGKDRPYLGLLMTLKTKVDVHTGLMTTDLSEEAVRWFRKSGQRVSNVSHVVPKATKRIIGRVQGAIDRVNAEAPQKSHRIIRWTFLPEQFSLETEEIGQSLKIRRWVVEEKYRYTIDSLFA